MNYLQIYNLESYLFDTVRPCFQQQGYLSAFDFFCIVIWKANRAKSKIAARLVEKSKAASLEQAVRGLTASLYSKEFAKERLRCLLEEWGFLLPMASAILTVLYPDEFTVYDIRVCNLLENYQKLANITQFDRLWAGYMQFCDAVKLAAPEGFSLRDKDRYLWGKSFSIQLQKDISECFIRLNSDEE